MICSSALYSDDVRRVASLPLPWNALSGKSILLTGATGMIGSFITDVLMNCPVHDFSLTVTGRNPQAAESVLGCYMNDSRFRFIRHDLEEKMPQCGTFHVIMHCAGNSYPDAFRKDPAGTLRGTVTGTSNLLEYASAHGTERFLYVSSAEVYGTTDDPDLVWKEHDSGYVDVLDVRSCYPSAKRAAESLCTAYSYQYGLYVSTARPSHVYGPMFTPSDNRVYAQLLRDAVAGRDLVLKSDGNRCRGYCYVADCVSALFHILFYGSDRQAYNITPSDGYISIRHMAALIAAAAGVDVRFDNPADRDSRQAAPGGSTHIDSTLLAGLGWAPSVTVQEGLVRTYRILRELK